jgi:riboflavin biosynthesis pyrimidine reductase
VAGIRVIHPSPGEVSVDELYGVDRPRLDDRPWVGICMIASLDGTTVVDGRSGRLGNQTDGHVLGALRRAADAVLVGASTVRAEGYGPPQRSSLRIGVVTSQGVDTDTELFRSGSGFLVMPEDGPADTDRSIDVVRAGRGRVDLALAVRRLADVMARPAFVQCEGGSHLNGALLASGCVDELDLTISPVLAGGDGPRVTTGAIPTFERFDLAHLATEDGYLYGRWVRPVEPARVNPAPS